MPIEMGNLTVTVIRPDPPLVAAVVPEVARAVAVPRRGPIGPPGLGGAGYSHHQTSPAATWVITHNLGRYTEPLLLLDDDPDTPVWADLAYSDDDHTTITLPTPATGWAHF